eukprot:6206291-Pleurochrysis_carterae.AAC.2
MAWSCAYVCSEGAAHACVHARARARVCACQCMQARRRTAAAGGEVAQDEADAHEQRVVVRVRADRADLRTRKPPQRPRRRAPPPSPDSQENARCSSVSANGVRRPRRVLALRNAQRVTCQPLYAVVDASSDANARTQGTDFSNELSASVHAGGSSTMA